MITNEQNKIVIEKDYSISIIRFISLLMIITCHFFQYYNMEIAWWLNVGVQIFLCISGFLYGQRKTNDVISFYNRRFLKILIPYYIIVIVFSVAHFLFLSDISIIDSIKMMLMFSTIEGLGHLWFVPTILFCYLITPLLEKLYELDCVKNAITYLLMTLVLIVSCAIFCVGFANGYHPAWIGCYIIGFALGVNERKNYLSKYFLITLFALLTSMNFIQIYIDYFRHITLEGKLNSIYTLWTRYNHVWLGVFIFLFLKLILDELKIRENGKCVLDYLDKYSYETYLVHQVWILGPLGLMAITKSTFLNVIIIIIISTFILKFLEEKTEKIISRCRLFKVY